MKNMSKIQIKVKNRSAFSSVHQSLHKDFFYQIVVSYFEKEALLKFISKAETFSAPVNFIFVAKYGVITTVP
jgi:hypothetical protein